MSRLRDAFKAEKYFLIGTVLLVSAWAISTFFKENVNSKIENFNFYRNAAAVNYTALATAESTIFSVLHAGNATRYDSIKGYANSLFNSSNILDFTSKAINDTTGEYLPKDENGIPMKNIQAAVYYWGNTKNLEELKELHTYLSRIQTPLYVKAEEAASQFLKELNRKKNTYDIITLLFIIMGTLIINYDKFIKYMRKVESENQ